MSSQKLFWPYDEVTLSGGNDGAEIRVESPWLTVTVNISDEQKSRAQSLIQKFQTQTLGAEDILDIHWFFSSLEKFPFCYVLPRQDWEGAGEDYPLRDGSLINTPADLFLMNALEGSEHREEVVKIAAHPLFATGWKWDVEGAMQFSQSPDGLDPRSFFSVARRFHLLNFVENDQTEALFAYVRTFASDKTKFEKASALMVRQNHYVTELCGKALEPGLSTAKGARPQVQEFIDAEYGHDRILKAALVAMGRDPLTIPVTSQSKVLMDLLRAAAERNFLAFAMIVDFFERSSYQESDPLAQVLEQGGLGSAARHINKHMEINDSGEHENVALGFLKTMGPITPDYAEEALRLAEATSNVIHLVSAGVREILESTDYLAD